MTKEREKAHRELQHALAAMTEATGLASHGPAALCYPLLKRSASAAVALYNAAKQLETLGIRDKPVALPALNKLAPVLLDILLDSFEPVLNRPEVRAIVRDLVCGDNPWHEAVRINGIAAKQACAQCGVTQGPAYPYEPSVRLRPDGRARCNDCHMQALKKTRLGALLP